MQETMTEMTFKASDIAMSHEMAAMWPLFVLLGLLVAAAVLVFVVHRRTFVRIFSATTATSGALLVVLFFLPWLGAQCSGTEMGTASGYQLAAGERSLSPEVVVESPVLELKVIGTVTVVDGDAKMVTVADADAKDDVDAKPWVYAGLALAAGLGVLGVTILLWTSTRRATGALVCVLGLTGCVLMGYVACIQSFDGWIKPKSPGPPTMPMAAPSSGPAPVAASDTDEVTMDGMMTDIMMQNLSVRTKWPLFASLALYVLAIGCGVLMRFKGPGMRASSAPTVTAPPEASPTPLQPTEPTTPDHQ